MPAFKPLINGREHSWSDIIFNVGGSVVVGVTSVNYDDEQVMEDNMGAGKFPVSRGYGGVKANASITMYASEVEALMQNAPNGNLRDIAPFPIIIQYLVGSDIITHILNNAQFPKNVRSSKTGDTKIEVELPLIVSHITWRK